MNLYHLRHKLSMGWFTSLGRKNFILTFGRRKMMISRVANAFGVRADVGVGKLAICLIGVMA